MGHFLDHEMIETLELNSQSTWKNGALENYFQFWEPSIFRNYASFREDNFLY